MQGMRVCEIILLLSFIILIGCTPVYQASTKVDSPKLIWKSPPQTSIIYKRSYPKLVNYAHRQDLLHGNAIDIEKQLAQWDIIILNHSHNLSLKRIRETNPYIKILIWIPLQGAHYTSPLFRGFKHDWYCKTANGKMMILPWNTPLANLYADNYGFVYHILEYLKKNGQSYDGVLYDCMWENPWKGADINNDGGVNYSDKKALHSATVTLLKKTRELFPEWIITGNGGVPWPEQSEYYLYANGNMHENALGDQFGDPGWHYLWEGYCAADQQRNLEMSRRLMDRFCLLNPLVVRREAPRGQWMKSAAHCCRARSVRQQQRVMQKGQEPSYHFINVDVRAKGRTQSQANNMNSLTKDDLRHMRLGLIGSMLLDNGYFGFDRGDCLHGQLWWFDEYDVDLGAPLGPYRKDIYGKGELSREFENGVVILNSSYWSIHVAFETSYTDVSLGKEGTRFEIPSQDARIFLKNSFKQ